MLRKYVKTIMLPLLPVCILVLIMVTGCANESAATGPAINATETSATPATTAPQTTTSESLQVQQIFADMMTAVKNINTYKFNMDMKSLMEMTGGDQAGTVSMVMNAEGFYDQLNKNMHMTMEMNMDMDVPEMEAGAQKMVMDMYMLDEYMYMKMDMPFIGEQWMKMPITDEIMDEYNNNLVNEQLELLASSIEIEFIKYETIDGVDCYVFKVIPDMKKLLGWALEQQTTDTGLDAEDMNNIADVFKDISYTTWITRDDKLPKKFDMSMNMNFSAEQFGEESGDLDSMSMTTNMVMNMFDYNVPETIVLPEEAEDALEIPQPEESGHEL